MGPIASSRDYRRGTRLALRDQLPVGPVPPDEKRDSGGSRSSGPEPAIVHSGPGQVAQREARQLYRGERGNSKGERKRRVRRGGKTGEERG